MVIIHNSLIFLSADCLSKTDLPLSAINSGALHHVCRLIAGAGDPFWWLWPRPLYILRVFKSTTSTDESNFVSISSNNGGLASVWSNYIGSVWWTRCHWRPLTFISHTAFWSSPGHVLIRRLIIIVCANIFVAHPTIRIWQIYIWMNIVFNISTAYHCLH